MSILQIFKCTQTEIDGAPTEIKILPLGNVKSQKGDFYVDEESFRLMKAKAEARGIDIVVDYEHQTLHGGQVPAGGWIKSLFLKDNIIYANVEWTPQAKQYIDNKEYRYLSPVVLVRKSDNKVTVLHSVALTNTPAIDGMFPIVNSIDINDYTEGEENMEFLKKLAELLGLGADATEEQILQKIASVFGELEDFKSKSTGEIVANKTICDLLGVEVTAKTEDVAAAILTLKQDNTVSTELKALKEKIEKREADDAVTLALKSGKISSAQKDWATEYALKDPTGFAKFIEKAPVSVPMGELDIETKAHKADFDDETVAKVCKQMGITKEDYEKHGKDSE